MWRAKGVCLWQLDYILTSCVENTDASWGVVAIAPGAVRLRRYVFECIQFKNCNKLRKQLRIGRLCHSLGVLSKGVVRCADCTRLVGRHIGETENDMKAVLAEARGSVLFIDEAEPIRRRS